MFQCVGSMQASTVKSGAKPVGQGHVQLQRTNAQNDEIQSTLEKVNTIFSVFFRYFHVMESQL